MKKISCYLLLIFFSSCQFENKSSKNNDQNIVNNNQDLNTIFENYYQEGLKLNPINATNEGDSRYNDQFPELITDEYKSKQKKYYSNYLEQVSKFDSIELTDIDFMSKSILEWECQSNLELLDFNTEYTPIDQMWSIHLIVGQLASAEGAQPFNTVADYYNWLVRLKGYVSWLENSELKMKEGINKGYVLPKSLIKKIIPQIKSLTNKDSNNNIFYSPINKFPEDFDKKSISMIVTAYENIISEKIIPAHQRLYSLSLIHI